MDDEQEPGDAVNLVDMGIAYGAAMANSQADKTVNFRGDFMPYQGKRQRMEKTLKYAAILLVSMVVLAVVGIVTGVIKLGGSSLSHTAISATQAEAIANTMASSCSRCAMNRP